MIEYRDTTDGITPEMLTGFFEGWLHPRTPQVHLRILQNSDYQIVATDAGTVVGFITALTDHVQTAFIPLLEVLPAYRNKGIGSELLNRMLAKLEAVPNLDLTCAPEMQGYFERFGLQAVVGMVIRNEP